MADTVVIINGPIIPAGQAVSDAVDISAGRIARITTPAGWDNADLSFQVSTDNNGFNDLYYADGREVMVVCEASRAIVINQQEWIPGLFLKIRSGSASQPRKQSASREFAIALLVEEPVVP